MMRVIQATNEHVLKYLENARQIDLEEVVAASGQPLEAHLPSLFEHIDSVKALIDENTGEVLGIGGVDPTRIPNIGTIWLLLSNSIEGRRIEFLRFSKRFLRVLFKDFDVLTNCVYKRNKLHIDWLNWLGAEWIGHTKDFSIFVLRRKE